MGNGRARPGCHDLLERSRNELSHTQLVGIDNHHRSPIPVQGEPIDANKIATSGKLLSRNAQDLSLFFEGVTTELLQPNGANRHLTSESAVRELQPSFP